MRARAVEGPSQFDVLDADDYKDMCVQGLTWRSTHDSLTGLEGRHLFLRRTNQLLDRLKAEGRRCVVACFDLDDFTSINDRYGEAVGDTVLSAVAGTINRSLRPTDRAARISGDRFAVVCCGIYDSADAYLMVERLATSIDSLSVDPVSQLTVTVSAGIALSDDDVDSETLLHHAESALRSAKRAGAGSIRFHDQSPSIASHRTNDRHADLRLGIDGGEIVPLFQPIIDLKSGLVKGFEALARWHHPTRGTIGPLDFIPLAERTGEIHRLGRMLLNESCQELAGWIEQGMNSSAVTMSVNVSASQLVNPAFPEQVRTALQTNGLRPSQLVLEVTESALITYERAKVAFVELKELGVQLGIDDFGMGFSSLARVEQLAFDYLKFDKSFIDGVGSPGRSRTIVASLLSLATELDLKVVAEGVETRAQLDYLESTSCQYGQGYFWSGAVHSSIAFEQARLAGVE